MQWQVRLYPGMFISAETASISHNRAKLKKIPIFTVYEYWLASLSKSDRKYSIFDSLF